MDATALWKLSYGLYVIGVQGERGLAGSVVDVVAQVTSDTPPLLVVGCMKNNYTPERIKATGEFTLSVLSEQVNPFVIANFGFQSARTADKWANVPYIEKNGLPVLQDGAVSYLHCRVVEIKELSTHTAFFVKTVDAWNSEQPAKPLIYGDYQKNMKTAAVEAFKKFKENGQASASGAKRQCPVCGYTYDGALPFEQLPADWICPLCGVSKNIFEQR